MISIVYKRRRIAILLLIIMKEDYGHSVLSCSPINCSIQTGYPSSPGQNLLLSKYDWLELKPSIAQLLICVHKIGFNYPVS